MKQEEGETPSEAAGSGLTPWSPRKAACALAKEPGLSPPSSQGPGSRMGGRETRTPRPVRPWTREAASPAPGDRPEGCDSSGLVLSGLGIHCPVAPKAVRRPGGEEKPTWFVSRGSKRGQRGERP